VSTFPPPSTSLQGSRRSPCHPAFADTPCSDAPRTTTPSRRESGDAPPASPAPAPRRSHTSAPSRSTGSCRCSPPYQGSLPLPVSRRLRRVCRLCNGCVPESTRSRVPPSLTQVGLSKWRTTTPSIAVAGRPFGPGDAGVRPRVSTCRATKPNSPQTRLSSNGRGRGPTYPSQRRSNVTYGRPNPVGADPGPVRDDQPQVATVASPDRAWSMSCLSHPGGRVAKRLPGKRHVRPRNEPRTAGLPGRRSSRVRELGGESQLMT
jgi:hypothetical protein